METIISTAHGVDRRLWAFLAFLSDSGRRVGEALSMEWVWMRLDVEPTHIILPTTKSGRQNLVPLGERLRTRVFTPENITSFQGGDADVGRRTRKSTCSPGPTRRLSAAQACAGASASTGRQAFPLLAALASDELLASGAPLQAVSRLLGHEAVTTTARVYDWTDGLSTAEWAEVGR